MKFFLRSVCFLILQFFVLSSTLNGQIYINELDSDTPGIDDKEFVENIIVNQDNICIVVTEKNEGQGEQN